MRVATEKQINVTFHGIGEPPFRISSEEAPVWVDELQFREHLDRMNRSDFVLVTFDDGNASDFEIALPELLKRKMKAIFFVVAGRINQHGYLSSEQIRGLVTEGMEIGSHGMRHQAWRKLAGGELREELHESKRVLEEVVGAAVTKAACPFGSYGRNALAALRSAGYKRVYTSDGGPTCESEWLQPRTTVHADDDGEFWEELVQGRQRPISMGNRIKRVIKRYR